MHHKSRGSIGNAVPRGRPLPYVAPWTSKVDRRLVLQHGPLDSRDPARFGRHVAPGIDELRWPAPVRPGDVLRVRVTVESANVSRTKPDRGLVRSLVEALNQRGEVVLSMRAMNLIRRRRLTTGSDAPHAS